MTGDTALGAVAVAIALPFVGALAGLLLGGRFPRTVRPLAVLPTAVSTALVVAVAADHRRFVVDEGSLQLTPTGAIEVLLGLRVDGLSSIVGIMVGVVALLVQIYSSGYMRGDPRYSSYAALVSLFTAAMLLVVFSADLIVLLVGWEIMGICSYFLIGHYWEHDWAKGAAVKAFIMTKAGDIPFLFGIFVLGVGAGSFRVTEVVAAAPGLSEATVTVATLLLLGGVVGKSAQFPLHSWLPDAMAGPTPISALIHAATMVAAGMYVVARLFPVFALAPTTLTVLAVIAAITMLGSALAALAQNDVKRILAFSTVSQLAYMGAGLAMGAASASMFHLLTHAGFKALLFLCAGVIVHQLATNDLSAMGGLRDRFPTTFWTMTAGLIALAGLPPFSGFFSKEMILHAAEQTALGHGEGQVAGWAGWLVLVLGVLTVGITAAYATRLWLRVFFGDYRGPEPESPAVEEEPIHAREAPGVMRWPLIVLAVPTVVLGFAGLSGSWLPSWLIGLVAGTWAPMSLWYAPEGLIQPLYVSPGAYLPDVGTSSLSVGFGLLAALWVYTVWQRSPEQDPARVLGVRLRGAFERAFLVDELYRLVLVRPYQALARAVGHTDDRVVDASVRGAGIGARAFGGVLRLSQNGNVQVYLTGLLAGVVVIALTMAVVS